MPNLLTSRRILRPFRPDQVPGLEGWWDASQSTVTDGSGNVTRISDLGNYGRHMSVTSTTKPIVGSGSVVGLPTVRFTTTGTYLETQKFSAETFWGVNRNSMTLFLACRMESGTIGARIYDGASGNRVDIRQDGSLTATFNSSTFGAVGFGSLTNFKACCIRFSPDLATSESWTNLTKNTPSTGFTGYAMGSNSNYVFRFGNEAVGVVGEFCEAMVFSYPLQNETIVALLGYLTRKWGTS